MRTLALAFVMAASPAVAETLPLGRWARDDGNTHVRIEPCGSALCAVNTWVRDRSRGEDVGHRLVMTVRPAGAGVWTGTAVDPQRDMSYAITISFKGEDMSTRGCIIGILCKTVGWRKLR